MLQTLLSMVLTEWLWYVILFLSALIAHRRIRVHVAIFSNECSPDVAYILFVVKINALGSGKIVGLTLTSLLTIGYAVVTFHELRAYYRSYKQHKLPPHHRKSSVNSDDKIPSIPSPTSTHNPSTLSPGPPPIISHIESSGSSSLNVPATDHVIQSTSHSSTITVPKDRHAKKSGSLKAHRPRRKQWSGNWDPMLLGIAAFQFVVFTYFVVSTELLLLWNPYQNDGNKWGFGQVRNLHIFHPIIQTLFGYPRSWP